MVACDTCGNWLHTRCIGLADVSDRLLKVARALRLLRQVR
eukprot:COSAG01_NODE_345_length_18538_cov_64.139433_2_plen_40_part_00